MMELILTLGVLEVPKVVALLKKTDWVVDLMKEQWDKYYRERCRLNDCDVCCTRVIKAEKSFDHPEKRSCVAQCKKNDEEFERDRRARNLEKYGPDSCDEDQEPVMLKRDRNTEKA